MPKGLLIQTNGRSELREINGLDDMYAAIGNDNLDWAAPGPLTYICYGYALYERNFNAVATALYHETHDTDDPLCGPVLVLGPPVDEDESDVPERYVRRAKEVLEEFTPRTVANLDAPLSHDEHLRMMTKMSRAQELATEALKRGQAVDFGGIQIGRIAPTGDQRVPWEGSRRTGAP